MSFYDVLGVSPGASNAEIHQAYVQLAKVFHPDQHPNALPAEQRQLAEAMARINEAYNALKSPESRATYVADADPAQPPPTAGRARPPQKGECMLCGSSPASRFIFDHQTAYVFRANLHSTDASFCRNCALSYGRAKQNRTLWTGWWGVLSFFRNLAIVYRNTRMLRKAARMTARRDHVSHCSFLRTLPSIQGDRSSSDLDSGRPPQQSWSPWAPSPRTASRHPPAGPTVQHRRRSATGRWGTAYRWCRAARSCH